MSLLAGLSQQGDSIADAQPLDSDLTAISALTTTSYGRSLLTPVDAAAARTLLGVSSGGVSSVAGRTGDVTLAQADISGLTTSGTPQFALLGVGVAAAAGNTIIANNTDSNRVLFAGTTKGIRFTHNSTGSIVEGVDNTGSASHQPLYLGGSYVATSISGTEKMRVDANALSVGASALATTFGIIPQVQSTGTTVSGFSSWLFNSAATAQPAVFFNKSASSTIGSHAVVSSSDRLGCFIWAGSDGASYVPASQLRTTVDGTVSSGVVPGKFELLTATAAGALTNKLEVNAAGQLKLNAYGAGTLVTDSSGNVTASSDASLKTVTGTFTRGLADVLNLTPRTYRWKESSGMNTEDENVGFIAQEVLEAIPEAVGQYRTTETEIDGKKTKKREKAELLTLSDRPLIAALVNAVRELNEKNAALEARVAALENGKASK